MVLECKLYDILSQWYSSLLSQPFIYLLNGLLYRMDWGKAMKAAMPSCDDAVFLRPLYLMVAISPICLLLNTPLHTQSGARTSKLGITTLLSVLPFFLFHVSNANRSNSVVQIVLFNLTMLDPLSSTTSSGWFSKWRPREPMSFDSVKKNTLNNG